MSIPSKILSFIQKNNHLARKTENSVSARAVYKDMERLTVDFHSLVVVGDVVVVIQARLGEPLVLPDHFLGLRAIEIAYDLTAAGMRFVQEHPVFPFRDTEQFRIRTAIDLCEPRQLPTKKI